jgi:hypothetical protein
VGVGEGAGVGLDAQPTNSGLTTSQPTISHSPRRAIALPVFSFIPKS